jgi:hypothetical protein
MLKRLACQFAVAQRSCFKCRHACMLADYPLALHVLIAYFFNHLRCTEGGFANAPRTETKSQ